MVDGFRLGERGECGGDHNHESLVWENVQLLTASSQSGIVTLAGVGGP